MFWIVAWLLVIVWVWCFGDLWVERCFWCLVVFVLVMVGCDLLILCVMAKFLGLPFG